ncbi:hypothetical protein L6R52_17780 [Myxococcota bacterium]|nr:hypothetical protein [Myxococcota bacterium]
MTARDHLGDALELPAVRVGLLLHTLLAIGLSFVPLLDVLGFERAFVSGLLATPVSAAIGIAMVRAARSRGGDDLARVAAHAIGVSFLMLVPTLFAGVVVELATQPCDQQQGMSFLVLVAGGNALFGASLGVVAATLSTRRWAPGLLVAAALAIFLGVALHRLYAEPQIFVYSLPFGYWPGSLYDEELEVSGALWAFRGYGLLVALTMLSAARMLADRILVVRPVMPRRTVLVGTVILATAAWMVGRSGESIGFALTRQTIEEQLSRRVKTEHFDLFVAPTVSADDVALLVEDHELRYDQLVRWFGFEPKGRIKSFVYANEDQKRHLMGASATQIARPWAREIHINGFGVPHPVLKHELAHVFAGELATGMFHVPASFGVLVNIGIVEGIAVAADWPANELTVHGWTRTMRELGLAPDMRTTLAPLGFWSISSARAYTVAGSFVRWLVERHGLAKVGVLYATNDFEEAFGQPLDALVAEWEAFVAALPLSKEDLTIAEHRFKRPGIFQKVCAHKAANLAKDGYEKLRSGDLEGGIAELEQLSSYAPTNVAPLVDIAQELARRGRLDEARRFAKRAHETQGITVKSAAEAREALAGIEWRGGQRDLARDGYRHVLDKNLSTGSVRLQLARLTALDAEGPAADVLRGVLLGDLSGSKALVRLGNATRALDGTATATASLSGLARYLYARQLEVAGAFDEAVVEAGRALAGPLPGAPIADEAALMHGRLLLRTRRPAEAVETFTALAARARTDALRLVAEDWADRARFTARGGPE